MKSGRGSRRRPDRDDAGARRWGSSFGGDPCVARGV